MKIKLRLGLPSGLFPSEFPTQTLYFPSSPIRVTWPDHLILLDLICVMICNDEYKIWSSSYASDILLLNNVQEAGELILFRTSCLIYHIILTMFNSAINDFCTNSTGLKSSLFTNTGYMTHYEQRQKTAQSVCDCLWGRGPRFFPRQG
jgi:hypothetical protein